MTYNMHFLQGEPEAFQSDVVLDAETAQRVHELLAEHERL